MGGVFSRTVRYDPFPLGISTKSRKRDAEYFDEMLGDLLASPIRLLGGPCFLKELRITDWG